MMFSTLAPNQICDIGVYNNNLNREMNHLYILNAPNSGDNETDPNPETNASSIVFPTHIIGGA